MDDNKLKRLWWYLGLFAAGAVLLFLLRRLFFLIFPLFPALIFSAAIRKSFRRLSPMKGGAKRILIVLVLLIFFALLSLGILLCADRLLRGADVLRRLISEHADDVADFFSDLTQRAESLMGQLLGHDMGSSVASRWPELLEGALNGILTALPRLVYGALQKIPRFFISLFVFVVSTYYFSCDWESVHRGIRRILPPRGQEILFRIRKRFLPTLWRWIKAWGLLFLLSLTQLFLGLLLLGQSGAFSKALLIALVDILPVLGCGTVLIPWSAIAHLTGNTGLGWGLLVLYLVTLITRQFAEPKLVGSSIGIHPLLSLFLMFLGLFTFGFTGLLLFPLGAACLAESLRE